MGIIESYIDGAGKTLTNDAVTEEITWVKTRSGVFPIIVKKEIPNTTIGQEKTHFIGTDPRSKQKVSYTGFKTQKPKDFSL